MNIKIAAELQGRKRNINAQKQLKGVKGDFEESDRKRKRL